MKNIWKRLLVIILLGIVVRKLSETMVSNSSLGSKNILNTDINLVDGSSIHECKIYIDFMECVIEKIDNSGLQAVLGKNLLSTKESITAVESELKVLELCEAALFSLKSQTYLFSSGCVIESDKPKIVEYFKDEVKDEGELNAVEKEVEELNAVEEVDSEINPEGLNKEEVEEIKEEIKGEEGSRSKTIEILQNAVGFLRVRADANVSSSQLGTLKPGEKKSVLDEKDGRYMIDFEDTNGWVSGKYVKEI